MVTNRSRPFVARLGITAVCLVAIVAAAPGSAARVTVAAPRTSSARVARAQVPAARAVAARASAGDTAWGSYHRSQYRYGVSDRMPAVRKPIRIIHAPRLDGAVYASPIVVNGVTIIVTENNTVYAFGPRFVLRWKRHLGAPARASELPCGNINPLGITGTPAYGAKFKVIYLAAELGGPPRHRLYALAVSTGAVRWSRSLDLPGVTASAMQQRGALTVTGGRVWVPFGGLAGDCANYKGRVVGIYRNGSGKPASYTVPTVREAGIWTPPGPTLDRYGQMYVSVGNGASGVGDRYDHSDSVLKLSPSGRLLDSFSPSSWASDNDHDLDLGSLGPTLVSGEKWVLAVGKSGYAYVLRRSHLGGIGGQVSRRYLCKAFGGTASVGDIVYVPCIDGLRAVRIGPAGYLHVLWHAAGNIIGSPVVGGGRVWSIDPYGGTLYALSPATGRVLNYTRVGTASHFATPAIYLKYVLVPTLTGFAVVSTS